MVLQTSLPPTNLARMFLIRQFHLLVPLTMLFLGVFFFADPAAIVGEAGVDAISVHQLAAGAGDMVGGEAAKDPIE